MKIIYLDHNTQQTTPCVATIGFFDGVHRGHQFIIKNMVQQAHQAGMEATVISFSQHPQQVLQPNRSPMLLTTIEEKLSLLQQTGVDNVIILNFTPQIAALSAQLFMENILSKQLQVKQLLIGYDNRFGSRQEDTFKDYVRYGKALGIKVAQSCEFIETILDTPISSSAIRKLLIKGDVSLAHQCLGYPYTLTAHVINGVKEGRKIGFPTANLSINELNKLIPAKGVYAVKAQIDAEETWYQGMTCISNRPTFNGTSLSIETNILDNFHQNIYGCKLSVAFYKRLRSEQKFNTINDLCAQIEVDKRNVKQFFSKK